MNKAVSVTVMLLVTLGACDETDPLVPDEEFILAVMVYDAGGRPLEGMSVGRGIELEGFDIYGSPRDRVALIESPDSLLFSYPNPFSGVNTTLYIADDVREVTLRVRDWRGREVRTLQQGRITGGSYSIDWDQLDEGGIRVISGVYTICLSLADTLSPHGYEFADSLECTVIDWLDPNWREMGVTDQTGFFSTRDLDFFPSLQGHGLQTTYNEAGDPLGSFSIGDTVTVTVSTPPPPEGGWIYHMSRRAVLVDGPNYLEFRFVPDDSTGVFVKSS